MIQADYLQWDVMNIKQTIKFKFGKFGKTARKEPN